MESSHCHVGVDIEVYMHRIGGAIVQNGLG